MAQWVLCSTHIKYNISQEIWTWSTVCCDLLWLGTGWFYPYHSGLLHWHWGGCMITPVTVMIPWWRHQRETFSALLALCAGNSPVIGEFPSQRPVTRSFDVFFDQRLNKRLSKQSRLWLFETPSRSLWRHCNDCLHTDVCVGDQGSTSLFCWSPETMKQATVLDARASRVKWPAQFMSHWYGILFTE